MQFVIGGIFRRISRLLRFNENKWEAYKKPIVVDVRVFVEYSNAFTSEPVNDRF